MCATCGSRLAAPRRRARGVRAAHGVTRCSWSLRTWRSPSVPITFLIGGCDLFSAVSLKGVGRIERPGRSAPLMSPGPGFARPSYFTSLRRTPHPIDPTRGVGTHGATEQPCSGLTAPGAYRSEVKEEGCAQRRPGDMSVGGRPAWSAHGANEAIYII